MQSNSLKGEYIKIVCFSYSKRKWEEEALFEEKQQNW